MKNFIYSTKHANSHNNIINTSKLIKEYYSLHPDPKNNTHNVTFGTSGHRGSSQRYSFNEAHLLAISQSIVQVRLKKGIFGPCYLGKDTRVLSEPAFISVLEVLTANFINVIIQNNNGYTPTPVISHAIVSYNKYYIHNKFKAADGIIITASHNPPEDGGIKYNSIYGGPASLNITQEIEYNANKIILNNLRNVNRITLNKAWRSGYIHTQDFVQNYVNSLSTVVNMQAIKNSGLKLIVHPLSGSSIDYWQNIAQIYQLNLTLINEKIDQTFSFICLDHDNCIRIDCSSTPVINGALSSYKESFDLFFTNDPDCDRHGIVTSLGILESDQYFVVAANYLFHNRPLWRNNTLSIGNTYVSSSKINQITRYLNCSILEVPVGFKWFTKGLFNGCLGFASEESAGASFLSFQGTPWSTDKDGLIMCLLAAEITAVSDKYIQQYYKKLNKNLNISSYNRIQLPISYSQKSIISNTLFHQINLTELAGDSIIKIINIIPSNTQSTMNGIKIITRNGWIACRLSGTELIYKIYCESFIDDVHRVQIEKEIINIINKIINI